MAAISTTIHLDAGVLQALPSHELADLAMASVKIIAERFVADEKYFQAKELLGILAQLQQRARPGFESTIAELTPSRPSR